MAEKTFITKCMQNIATKEQWDTIASTYIPLNGELIFYSNINNFKVGDGTTTLDKLKFYLSVYPTEEGKYNLVISSSGDVSWEKIQS